MSAAHAFVRTDPPFGISEARMSSSAGQSKLALYIFVLLPALYILIDTFYFWNSQYNVEHLTRFTCDMFPFAKLSSPVFSRGMMSFLNNQCAGDPNREAVSVILYMLKLALTIAAVLFLFFYDYLGGGHSAINFRQLMLKRYPQDGGKRILIFYSLIHLFLFEFAFLQKPGGFPTTLLHKITEDWTTLALFWPLYMGMTDVSTFPAYVIQQLSRKRPD